MKHKSGQVPGSSSSAGTRRVHPQKGWGRRPLFTNTFIKCAKKNNLFCDPQVKEGYPGAPQCAGRCPVRDFLGWGRRPLFIKEATDELT